MSKLMPEWKKESGHKEKAFQVEETAKCYRVLCNHMYLIRIMEYNALDKIDMVINCDFIVKWVCHHKQVTYLRLNFFISKWDKKTYFIELW